MVEQDQPTTRLERTDTPVLLNNSVSPPGVFKNCLTLTTVVAVVYVLVTESNCARAVAPAKLGFLWCWLISQTLGLAITLAVCALQRHTCVIVGVRILLACLKTWTYFWGVYLCIAGSRHSCAVFVAACDVVLCVGFLLDYGIPLCMERSNLFKRFRLHKYLPVKVYDSAEETLRFAPVFVRSPPWNLSGNWKLGQNGENLYLRHWGRTGVIFSVHEPDGGETFFGRVLPKSPHDEDDWCVVGAFGSRQAVLGDVGQNGNIISWPSFAQWSRDTIQSPIPHAASATLSMRRTFMSSQKLKYVVMAALILVVLIAMSLINQVRLTIGSIIIAMCTFASLYCVYRSSVAITGCCRGVRLCLVIGGVLMFGTCGMCLVGFCALLIRALWPASIWIHYGYVLVGCSLFSFFSGLVRGFVDWRATVHSPETWHESVLCVNGTEELEHHSIVRQALNDFQSDCDSWKNMYSFRLEVVEIFVLQNAALVEQFEQAKKIIISSTSSNENPNVRHLYHGTSAAAAKSIVSEGFRLPTGSGMFGKGIYFADTPLKSWQYSSGTGSEWMLICDVLLGRQKKMPTADSSFTFAKLKNSLAPSSESPLLHDSLVGMTKEEGGSLRVPEYVVFKPEQILPRFLVRVCERHVKAGVSDEETDEETP